MGIKTTHRAKLKEREILTEELLTVMVKVINRCYDGHRIIKECQKTLKQIEKDDPLRQYH